MRTQASKLENVGVWTYPSTLSPASVSELEKLGYSSLWLADTKADLEEVDRLLAATERMIMGSYIINVWSAPAPEVAGAFHRIDAAFPGRFVLGIGAGHQEINPDYRTPLQAVAEYLDQLDDLDVPPQRRAVAALGPRMLRLARDRAAAALPYLVTADYIRSARNHVGPTTTLISEQKVVLTDDQAHARELGRDGLRVYLGLSNVRRSLSRIGFQDHDMAPPGSDRLLNALLAFGNIEYVAMRVHEHLAAGADQVLVHALTADNDMMPPLRALASRL